VISVSVNSVDRILGNEIRIDVGSSHRAGIGGAYDLAEWVGDVARYPDTRDGSGSSSVGG
jgi:hypothetical protein